MTIKEFTVISSYDSLPLQGILFIPDSPKGIVQILHGMVEYKKRYEPFMRFLAENGYIAACHDHRGHGDSVLTADDYGWFGDLSANAIVEDGVEVTKYLKSQYPNLPIALFGHSMGSMVARCYIQEHDLEIDKLILSGSPCKNPLAGMGIAMEKCVRLFRGGRHRSKLLAFLSTGNGDKNFKGEGEGAWLTRDRSVVEAFHSDKKCGFVFTCNGFENLFKLLKYSYTKKRYKVFNPTLPTLIVSGEADPVLGGKKKWEQLVAFSKDLGYTSVETKLYGDMRHEILNEIGKEEVQKDILRFLEN
ncbi:MAG: alpha/beta fold hydrolase [Clostridia bacterium]|nr:alpha/beta fold hydrolase [Clostridia bacterium]